MRALIYLPNSYFSLPTLLVGDFKLLYSRRQPLLIYSYTTFAEIFLEWLDRLGLQLISKIDTPIYNRGNVLDLAFILSSPDFLGTSTRVV